MKLTKIQRATLVLIAFGFIAVGLMFIASGYKGENMEDFLLNLAGIMLLLPGLILLLYNPQKPRSR